MSINANNDALNEILEAVNELPISKEEQTKSIDITENGTTVVAPDEGMTLGEVTVNVEVESSGDDFIGIKYSNFDSNGYRTPKTADARSLDNILREPSTLDNAKRNGENGKCLYSAFTNTSTHGGAGYFSKLEEVYVPRKACGFEKTFANCYYLTTIHGDLSNIEYIQNAFEGCASLDINSIIARMTKLHSIGNYSFSGCTQLTELTLPATITTITSLALKGCANLTKIYCKFAEGSVTGAPWGAPNADIEVVYVTEV